MPPFEMALEALEVVTITHRKENLSLQGGGTDHLPLLGFVLVTGTDDVAEIHTSLN